VQPLLFFLFLSFAKNIKKIHILTLLPAFAIAVASMTIVQVSVEWGTYGWSYSLGPYFTNITLLLILMYTLAALVIGISLVKKAPTMSLRKKYMYFILGVVVYTVGLIITNLAISISPHFPPFGGILATVQFLFIAYAILLPTEKIEVLHTKNMKKFSEDYSLFLKKLLEETPGKELGENVIRFKDHLQNLGLSDVVEFKRGKISFRPEPKLDPGEVADKSLDFMKQQGWALSAVKPFTDVFVDTYEAMKPKSKKDADEWFERMLRKHGAFLHRHGILDAMPEGARIPGIFRELEVGKSYLVQEDRPRHCLEVLREAVNYGFKGLCFTMRYPPQKVRDEYGLEGVDIIWLKSKPEKDVKTLAPDRLDELEKTISEFIVPRGTVVMVDAFDQIKVVNGFEKSMEFLQKIKVAAVESETNLLISMRPESVWEEESAAIAKITKPHRSGPKWTSFELL